MSELKDKYQTEVFTASKKHPLPYRILSPRLNEGEENQYPLIIFLHGSGERGDDNERHLKHGGSLFIKKQNVRSFPAYVVFPQCGKDDFWVAYEKNKEGERNFQLNDKPNPGLEAVMELTEKLIYENKNIDASRIYLIGLSMGGMAVLELLARRPKYFAAAISICGGTSPEFVKRYAEHTPLWLFHGEKDKAVPVRHSREIVAAYEALNLEVKYTEYKGVGHVSWHKAFREKTFLQWLFSFKKKHLIFLSRREDE